ncbi:hypothetical protein JY97_12980 [Alkalispirochaeta odontotermitis]|nr:hypothetical protein JY97_12980 [Alkalispirochaeta odontotermitis]CAB1078113.1 hypothetical protein D1AOALGA4SA_5878 [Olavius algarvensis Delta 1 endosymbiont]
MAFHTNQIIYPIISASPYLAPAPPVSQLQGICFYEKIDNLQGVRNTYIAGEILSFSNIARVMENAVSVAERMQKNRLV